MKRILAACFILVTFATLSQNTKKIKEKHENPWYTEEYHVLKSDKKIKHGNYRKFGYENNLVLNGYYKNNKKDSTWTEYFWKTEIIESQGNYKEGEKTELWTKFHKIGDKSTLASKGEYKMGKRIGIWEFYNRNAELIQKYNFDTKELLFFKPNDEIDKEYEIRTENGTDKVKLDRPPMYIGGQNEVADFISGINYPGEAIEKGISGTVWISFFINNDGKAVGHEVHEGIGGGCDSEALRVVKEIPDNWLPGILNEEKVTAKYLYPIKFALN